MSNNKNKKHKKPQIGAGYRPPFTEDVLALPVSELDIREDTRTLLEGGGVGTLMDVLIREEKDFYRIPTFNKKNLLDLKGALTKRNLFLRPTEEKKVENKENEQQEKREKSEKPGKPNINSKQGERSGKNQKPARPPQADGNERKEKPVPPKAEKIKEEPDIYVKVNKGGKWGFKDREGNQKVAPVYDEVFCFKEDICCVEKDEKFGFINRMGEEIIPVTYDCAMSFSEGYACVFKGEKCGYINAQNEVVIDFKYDAGTPVIGGECRVKRDGKWGELHLDKPNEVRWIN